MLLRPGYLSLDELQALHVGGQRLRLDPAALPGIAASAAVVRRAAEGRAPVYGVNTGFGKLASSRISEADLTTLQINLIRSHSVGVGEPLPPPVDEPEPLLVPLPEPEDDEEGFLESFLLSLAASRLDGLRRLRGPADPAAPSPPSAARWCAAACARRRCTRAPAGA